MMAWVAVGCGGSAQVTSHTVRRAGRRAPAPVPAPPLNLQSVPTPGPTGVPAPPTDVSVIRAWSEALRRGDVGTAAQYFALPSVMVNGTDTGGAALVLTIQTRAQAEEANATLPCGAQLISTDQRGRYVNALFRLTGRPGPGGSNCGGGVGTTARTNFLIAHGRIVEWLRAPSDPGDNGTSPTPTHPAPPAPQSPLPTV